MKQEYAMKWAEALESGLYPQSKGTLRDDKGYCCLGVACEVAGKKFTKNPDNPSSCKYQLDDGRSYAILPREVQDELGMGDSVGSLPLNQNGFPTMIMVDSKEFNHLAAANDGGKTFKQIAQAIRENWKQL